MLTRKRPDILNVDLRLKGQGEEVTCKLVFHNHDQAAMDARIEEDVAAGRGGDSLVLFVLKEWESEYPLDTQGLAEAEKGRPGLCMAIMQSFYEARVVTKAKN